MLKLIVIPIALALYIASSILWCCVRHDRREWHEAVGFSGEFLVVLGVFFTTVCTVIVLSWSAVFAIGSVGLFFGYVWAAQELEWFKIERRSAERATLDSNSSVR